MDSFDEFLKVVKQIRKECPWDSVQTHESLKPYLREETEEVLQGVDRLIQQKDAGNLCEELGDVLFQIVLHSVIAEEEGLFTVEDVVMGVMNKMKYRHPKVFSPEDKEAVALSWEELKRREKTLTS